ncbi:hypothetical protein CRG98_024889 [Punica granatum]|uniref:Uncharacterized protein n=1 Tax=Punica granatum TaxID=22663 RepID=A0A2I0JEM9_PUNGR|nr:hypothetical protein CRG98_024889 [Punica granatum]
MLSVELGEIVTLSVGVVDAGHWPKFVDFLLHSRKLLRLHRHRHPLVYARFPLKQTLQQRVHFFSRSQLRVRLQQPPLPPAPFIDRQPDRLRRREAERSSSHHPRRRRRRRKKEKKMCCGSRVCMLCTCLILVVILIGLLFGFGVFKSGFHKLKDTVNVCDPAAGGICGRPFLAPPPPF